MIKHLNVFASDNEIVWLMDVCQSLRAVLHTCAYILTFADKTNNY